LQKNRAQVFFGARVTYADEGGEERVVRIVGVDETARGPDHIAWVAPVARAILKARVGDLVEVRTPKGVETLEILAIAYPD
jgi:transcription elongation factor GreB